MANLLRESIERALAHHGIDGKWHPVNERRPWLVATTTGTKSYTTGEVKAYCQGLADKEKGVQRDR